MVTINNCMVSGSFEEGTMLDGTFKRFPRGFPVDRNGRIIGALRTRVAAIQEVGGLT